MILSPTSFTIHSGRLGQRLACLAISLALANFTPLARADGESSPAETAKQEKTATEENSKQDSKREKTSGQREDERGTKSSSPPQLRSETFRLMDAYVISNLQESLDLTDEQFAKVLPIVKKLQSDRRTCAMKRISSLRTLRRTLQSGRATEAGVGEILKEVKSAVADEHAMTVANIQALDAQLTPLQQAKYRVFEAEVDSRLRHLLARTKDREASSDR